MNAQRLLALLATLPVPGPMAQLTAVLLRRATPAQLPSLARVVGSLLRAERRVRR